MDKAVVLESGVDVMDTQDFRFKVRKCLCDILKKENDVLVLTEGGSRSFGNAHDNLSDMDFICVASEKIHNTSEKRKERSTALFSIIKEALDQQCAPIEFEHDYLWDFDLFHKLFRFKSTKELPLPPTLVLDFGIVFEEAIWKPCTVPEQHGIPFILFDKENLISPNLPEFDVESHVARMKADITNTLSQFGMFQSFIGKEFVRGHYLGAWDYYREYTLAPLIKFLNIKYDPLRYFFGLRYVHHFGYPKELLETIQKLYFMGDPKDILHNQKIAIELFYNTAKELQNQDLHQRVADLSQKVRKKISNE